MIQAPFSLTVISSKSFFLTLVGIVVTKLFSVIPMPFKAQKLKSQKKKLKKYYKQQFYSSYKAIDIVSLSDKITYNQTLENTVQNSLNSQNMEMQLKSSKKTKRKQVKFDTQTIMVLTFCPLQPVSDIGQKANTTQNI